MENKVKKEKRRKESVHCEKYVKRRIRKNGVGEMWKRKAKKRNRKYEKWM